LHGKTKDTITKVIEEHKPKVIDALNNVKKVVIEGAVKIVVELANGVVKILSQGETSTSDGATYGYTHHNVYVVIDSSSPSTYSLTDCKI